MAIPTNSDRYRNTCTEIISASCVKWPNNMELSFLELCTGDSMVDVVLKLTTALEEIQAAYDVAKIELGCLTECDLDCELDCEDDVKLHTLLNCMIKAHCDVNTRVTTLEQGASVLGGIDFTCSTTAASMYLINFDKNNYTDKQLMEYLLALICGNYNRIDSLDVSTELKDLTDRIKVLEDIQLESGDQIIPVVSDVCNLWTGSKSILEAITLLSYRLSSLEKATIAQSRPANITSCDKPVLSTPSCYPDAIKTIQNSGWGIDLSGVTNQDTSTLEGKINQLYALNCVLIERMASTYDPLEDCCKTTCADIKTAFYVLRTPGGGYQFNLTWDGSLVTPDYIGECSGSLLTINAKDISGNLASWQVSISDLSGGYELPSSASQIQNLDFTNKVDFEIAGCFEIISNAPVNTSCFVRETASLSGSTTQITVCNYTVSSWTTGVTLQVRYTVSGNPSPQSLLVSTNTFALPGTATIETVVQLSGATVPTVVSTECGTVAVDQLGGQTIFINDDLYSNDTDLTRLNKWELLSFEVNGVEYPITTTITLGSGDADQIMVENADQSGTSIFTYINSPIDLTADIGGACSNVYAGTSGAAPTVANTQTHLTNLQTVFNTGVLPITVKGVSTEINDDADTHIEMQLILSAPTTYDIRLNLVDTTDPNKVMSIKARKNLTDGSEYTVCANP